ncbi:hypothetical protein H696_00126 [Fonticula alba]|uniref:Uncharacterized protein n=1 Tax=Fonticula alba TaxID=691883 RepID=A0A058ZDU8_FONAL|nr:hypothetical protein H696_00126 [Fonticula alba]KCV72534.1 hypothetical protein H696_00126 [Fonticula alba]|eukprot:XP_009492235.1 hypothetical protein H696_00126 [Fonticula alba]
MSDSYQPLGDSAQPPQYGETVPQTSYYDKEVGFGAQPDQFNDPVLSSAPDDLEAGAPAVGAQRSESRFDTTLGLPLGAEAALCYIFGCLTGAFFLICERKNDYVRFHAWQSCITFGIMLLIHLIFIWSIFSLILIAFDLMLIIFLMYMAHAHADALHRFKIPLIGALAEKWVDEE